MALPGGGGDSTGMLVGKLKLNPNLGYQSGRGSGGG